MTDMADSIRADREAVVPVPGQSFSSKGDWVARARYALTAHEKYHNTEHDGPAKGWRGEHFTAMCFDQLGRRVRSGGDFQRAENDGAFPVYWVWPDQIAALLSETAALRARVKAADELADEVEMFRDEYGHGHLMEVCTAYRATQKDESEDTTND